MGASLCCFSQNQERKSLKLSEFNSESTCDSSLDLYQSQASTDHDYQPNHRFDCTLRENSPSFTEICNSRSTCHRDEKIKYTTGYYVSTYVGLTPIIEEPIEDPRHKRRPVKHKLRRNVEPRFPSSDSAETPHGVVKFLNYGSMKHYQRFVKSN